MATIDITGPPFPVRQNELEGTETPLDISVSGHKCLQSQSQKQFSSMGRAISESFVSTIAYAKKVFFFFWGGGGVNKSRRTAIGAVSLKNTENYVFIS